VTWHLRPPVSKLWVVLSISVTGEANESYLVRRLIRLIVDDKHPKKVSVSRDLILIFWARCPISFERTKLNIFGALNGHAEY